MTSEDSSWIFIWLLLGAMPLTALVERLHASRARRRGHNVAFFGCMILPSAPVAPEDPTVRDTKERASVKAIDMLPCERWQEAKGSSDDCALCLEPYREGELIMTIPVCSHTFHKVCAQRWLFGQRFKTRRCPLCNADALQEVTPSASSTSSSTDIERAQLPEEAICEA